MNSVFRVEILVLTYVNITWQTCGLWLIISSWSTGVSLHKTHQVEFETVYMYLQYFLLWRVIITEETQLHLFPSFSSHLSSCWILLPLVELPLCFYCCVSCLQWKLFGFSHLLNSLFTMFIASIMRCSCFTTTTRSLCAWDIIMQTVNCFNCIRTPLREFTMTLAVLHSFMDSAWGICHMPTTTE